MLAKEPLGIKVMTDIVCRTVNEEISNMCRRSENSVLRKREYEGLSDLSWKEIYIELYNNPSYSRILIGPRL